MKKEKQRKYHKITPDMLYAALHPASGEKVTQKQVADQFGKTRQRINQILAKYRVEYPDLFGDDGNDISLELLQQIAESPIPVPKQIKLLELKVKPSKIYHLFHIYNIKKKNFKDVFQSDTLETEVMDVTDRKAAEAFGCSKATIRKYRYEANLSKSSR